MLFICHWETGKAKSVVMLESEYLPNRSVLTLRCMEIKIYTLDLCLVFLCKGDGMKKGILVVSFGTSYEHTRKLCIGSIENDIQNNFKDYEVRRSFTSYIIIRKLKRRDNMYLYHPLNALQTMIKDGFKEIIVQPLHILPGFEYEKVLRAVHKMKERYDVTIKLARPLLFSEESYDVFIEAIFDRIPEQKENQGVLFVGHGTEHFSNACYSMLQNKMLDIRDDIIISNVEGYPMMDDVIDRIKSYDDIVLAPLMIVAGDHARNDIFGEEDSYYTELLSKGVNVIKLNEGLGQNPKIREIFVNSVKEVIGG